MSKSIFRTLALLVDVPLFLFLSGQSISYAASVKKTFDNLLKVYIQYILFMALVDLYCGFVLHPGTFSVSTLLYQMVFQGETTDFPVVIASMWFMPMWIPIALYGSILMAFLNRTFPNKKERDGYLCRIIVFFLIGVGWFSLGGQPSYFAFGRQFCFYMFFFLMGCFWLNRPISGGGKCFGIYAAILAVWFLISRLLQLPAKDLQSVKFPPHIMYLVASLFSVTTVVCLRGKMDRMVNKCRLIQFVGRNALSFYFAQGIGSSLCFVICPYVSSLESNIVLLICFLSNLAITLTIGTILSMLYRGVFYIFGQGKNLLLRAFGFK